MDPLAVATAPAAIRWRWSGRVTRQPFRDLVVVELLGPQHARERLSLDTALVFGHSMRAELAFIKGVGFGLAQREHLLGIGERFRELAMREAQQGALCGVRRDRQRVMRSGFRAQVGRVDLVVPAVDHRVVDPVFYVRAAVPRPPQSCSVRLVLSEQQLVRSQAGEPVIAECLVARVNQPGADLAQDWSFGCAKSTAVGVVAPPGPGVAEPERRQQVERRWIGSVVGGRDADDQVGWSRFGVLHVHVEVAVFGKNARVHQLVLRLVPAPPAVLRQQVGIWEGAMRVLVECPHVGVARRRVEIEVVLLDVFAVITLWSCQAKQPLFEDRVCFVP